MKTILHCDANNFYASVECLLDETLRGKPVAVSGNPDKRHGIILAKNELAKKFDIKTGDVIWQAKNKCPDLVVVPAQHNKYMEFSRKLFDIYTQYTDRVEPFGIDECWLDVTGSQKLFGDGEKIATELRARIKKELGLTISVGVSYNKIFAKLGSDIKKPDATTIISQENYKKVVWPLPVGDLLMIGRRSSDSFGKIGISTIGELANTDIKVLTALFGINGAKYREYANGECADEVRLYYEHHIPKSIGNSTTMPKDIHTRGEAEAVIMALSEMVAIRMRRHGFVAGGVSFGVKYSDLSGAGKQMLLHTATDNAGEITANIMVLYDKIVDKTLAVRALSVSTYDLGESRDAQMSFFCDEKELEKRNRLDEAIDQLRKKYGYGVLKSALVLEHPFICDDLEDDDFVPFD
ncbi:MAG: DNA polymerase IV, partial [Clostridia bacterium]